MKQDQRIRLNLQCHDIMKAKGMTNIVATLGTMTLGDKLRFIENHKKQEARKESEASAIKEAGILAIMTDEDFLTLAFKVLKKSELKHMLVDAGCTTFDKLLDTRKKQLDDIAAGHREPCWTCRDIVKKLGLEEAVKSFKHVEKGCLTCKHIKVGRMDEPCLNCSVNIRTNWTPKK